jgi:hypothetical protein
MLLRKKESSDEEEDDNEEEHGLTRQGREPITTSSNP